MFSVKKIIFLLINLLFVNSIFAQYGSLDQYKGEIGLQGGCSFYLGDANPSTPFHTPRPSFGGFMRYNISPRYAMRFAISKNQVVGNSTDFKERFPEDKQASFKRDFTDLSARFEFNFFDYGLPAYNRECKWFSPYIFVGVGLTTYADKYRDMNQITFNIPF